MALKNLSKRQDIIIKSADKGGAVVVWRSDLYKEEEALRQLSDTSFYAKVEKDLTSNNQKIVKDTIQNLIGKLALWGLIIKFNKLDFSFSSFYSPFFFFLFPLLLAFH